METRRIGSLDVTVVGVGCNNFGRELDYPQSREVIHAALDAGLRFFDTADSYGTPKTTSEEYVGKALEGHRDEVVLATKIGSRLDETRVGGRPDYLRSALDASLRRLRTDRIDLLQFHWPDPTTPLADTVGAFVEMVDQGKALEIGCSNFTAEQLHEADALAPPGRPRFVSVQNEYSLLARGVELEVLPACAELGIAFLPYFPLFNGMLTGKYRRDVPPAKEFRLANRSAEIVGSAFTARNFDLVEQLARFAEARGRTLLELAYAWLLAQPTVPSVIAGVTSVSQVRANAAAAGWALDEDELAELDLITGPVEPWAPPELPFPVNTTRPEEAAR